ncbi:MAG TPA: hypothetical protein VGM30_01075 [Puia sp.]
MLKRLQRVEAIVSGDWAIYLTTAFMASSLFANVIIGWAACVEIFIPVLLSLAAGLLLFERVQKAEASPVGKDGRVWRISVWACITGCSGIRCIICRWRRVGGRRCSMISGIGFRSSFLTR